MTTFLDAAADLQWLRETHLKGFELPSFGSAVVIGNEDCPARISLYASAEPNHDDQPIAVFRVDSGGTLVQWS